MFAANEFKNHPLIDTRLPDDSNPYLSIDCVVFGFDFEKLNVLLVERSLEDENGQLIFSDQSLVGHHTKYNESLEDAASRVLKQLTGLSELFLEQFHVFSHPKRLKKEKDQLWLKAIGRDIEKQVISCAFYSLVNTSDVNVSYVPSHAKWHDVNTVQELAFDHNEILKKALESLRLKFKREPIAFELLPKKFTLTQLHKLYEAVLGIDIDKRNFRKRVLNVDYVVALNEKQKEVSHKPAQLFIFSKDVYEATKKEELSFQI